MERESLNKLVNELAYSGVLFWLPLLISPKERHARYHANQGLWVLILSVIACTGIRVLGAVNRWLEGGVMGIISSGIYSLIYIGFLFLMLFLLWNVIVRAMDIHNEKEPKSILFFEQISLIKDKEGVD